LLLPFDSTFLQINILLILSYFSTVLLKSIQVAERVVDRAIGKTRRYFISNAPIGHYCYAYSPAVQKQRKQYGAKVFFYRAQLIEGTVKLETKLYKDYAWIGR
jgi:hypothetical protein